MLCCVNIYVYLHFVLFFPSFSRFSISLVYFSLSLNVGSFGPNIYLTQAIFGAIEIPSYLSGYVLNERLGRRLSQSGFIVLGGVACLLILAIPEGTVHLCILCDHFTLCPFAHDKQTLSHTIVRNLCMFFDTQQWPIRNKWWLCFQLKKKITFCLFGWSS